MCAFRGHAAPAAAAPVLAEEDSGLGIDLPDGRRLARCLRCDAWISVDPPPPGEGGPGVLQSLEGSPMPRRGKQLREAIITRLIAVDRGLHSLLFAIIALGALALRADLSIARASATRWLKTLNSLANQTGGSTHPVISRELHRILTLRRGPLLVLAFTAIGYCIVEGAEAIGLWRERRWAEYLTALATAGFLPFEISELMKSVSVLKLVVLALNGAILIWLVITKHLFGVGRRHSVAQSMDVREVFGPGTAGSPFVKAG
ncbi:MAG TPA: DUF2127 domain-containing protein [Actinomycetota bacterium]|nr:DUF2127 domain-containing protein [Actinomycetota bacterium]